MSSATLSIARVFPATATGRESWILSDSPERGWYSYVHWSVFIDSGTTSGVPLNTACQSGLTRNVQTSLQGLSLAARSSSVSVGESADSHSNCGASEAKLAAT